ncbi:hypothetical protein CDCA_CDCA02G0533 [Cyanidium caldarium]|uniref:Uncharacterized protein n=1 Tax=Cyanidium caldarium TaxID=2771 RepID=A0AAV9IQI0_CYACA|nr:hypothetical protein CDCA_CDCA02G0533 [Cyanidium caldarium]
MVSAARATRLGPGRVFEHRHVWDGSAKVSAHTVAQLMFASSTGLTATAASWRGRRPPRADCTARGMGALHRTPRAAYASWLSGVGGYFTARSHPLRTRHAAHRAAVRARPRVTRLVASLDEWLAAARSVMNARISGVPGGVGVRGSIDERKLQRLARYGERVQAVQGEIDDADALIPLVLVVGATGRTGRLIVRKLLLGGFRVRALVRNLTSATVEKLGIGCEYVKADLRDKDSLLDAVYGVDKVICAVESEDETLQAGVRDLIRVFQDARFVEFGRRDSAKVTLFHFQKDAHLTVWSVDTGEVDSLVLPSGRATAAAAAATEEGGLRPPTTRRQALAAPRASFARNAHGNAAFHGRLLDVNTAYAVAQTVSFAAKPLNFVGFSGVILRCLSDGQEYTFVVRTQSGTARGVQFAAPFRTAPGRKWTTVRLAFSDFLVQNCRDLSVQRQDVRDAVSLDLSCVTQLEVMYEARRNHGRPPPSPTESAKERPRRRGEFYLVMDYVKAYRTQDEPEFVLVSCMREAELQCPVDDKRVTERALKASGLSYCIVRPGLLTEEPGGIRNIRFDQARLRQPRSASGGHPILDAEHTPPPGASALPTISRADVADICVSCLLDARGCNVTFDAFASWYAPTVKTPSQGYSILFGQLRPNL